MQSCYLRPHVTSNSQTPPALPQCKSNALLESANVVASWCVATHSNSCSVYYNFLISQLNAASFILKDTQHAFRIMKMHDTYCS